jgi:hypothetical protein
MLAFTQQEIARFRTNSEALASGGRGMDDEYPGS